MTSMNKLNFSGMIIGVYLFMPLFSLAVTTAGNVSEEESRRINPPSPYMIIWFHSAGSRSLESLEKAISSRLLSHVMILYKHRSEGSWKKNQEVRRAIEITKKAKIKLIWCRDLWAYSVLDRVEIQRHNFFTSKYYVDEIRAIRAESVEMGADFVAFDTEPYAYSPIKLFLNQSENYPFTNKQIKALRKAVSEAINQVGKVDFILPAGASHANHPYTILGSLGKLRISESTYYANEAKIRRIPYPYEIFGAYVNTIRENSQKPQLPFFKISDIFDRYNWWVKQKGIFLFTERGKENQIADELIEYARMLQQKEKCIKDVSNPKITKGIK